MLQVKSGAFGFSKAVGFTKNGFYSSYTPIRWSAARMNLSTGICCFSYFTGKVKAA
jgi:hypothetical protein